MYLLPHKCYSKVVKLGGLIALLNNGRVVSPLCLAHFRESSTALIQRIRDYDGLHWMHTHTSLSQHLNEGSF